MDDAPFGGGAGMVLAPGPVFAAVEAVDPPRPLLLLGPGGRRFDQGVARELLEVGSFSLLCGRYEGVDQRIADHLCDGELSIGDYVLAGGELAALVVIEAVARLVPGVIGNDASVVDEIVLRRAARVPPLHPPGVVPRLGRSRGAAVGGPRPRRPLAEGGGRRPAPSAAART